MDLSIKISERFSLKDPFMIASSHWTSTESAFRQLSTIRPSAITLKTTSAQFGGDGVEVTGKPRVKRPLVDSFGKPFATYTDGPPTLELWDIPTTYFKTTQVKKHLQDCLIGLSVLQGENYNLIKKSVEISSYGFVELNCKYSFRKLPNETLTQELEQVGNDIIEFLSVFQDLPVLVKLSREVAPLLESAELQRILKLIYEAKAGIIVANSRKLIVPPTRDSHESPRELGTGVVVGEHLFLETYTMIRQLYGAIQQGKAIPPIVACGGISDIGGVIDVIAGGAKAVQLCTLLDRRGVQVIPLLRQQLESLCREFESFERFSEEMRSNQETWFHVAKVSRGFQQDEQQIVEKVFKDNQQNIIKLLAETLRHECENMVLLSSAEANDQVQENLRFVVTRGNASTFLLSRRCTLKLGFWPIELESASEFRKLAGSKEFIYDFAIIPASSLEFLLRDKEVNASLNCPILIGPVAKSIFELVGCSSKSLEKIVKVYHFAGTSSRHALGELLKVHKPETLDLIRPKLIPLLQFWEDNSAILAKPPLSRIYGMLGKKDIMKDWGSIWETKEELILIASKRFMSTSNGDKLAQAVLRHLKLERDLMFQNLERFALELRSFGFLKHCSDLLIGLELTV